MHEGGYQREKDSSRSFRLSHYPDGQASRSIDAYRVLSVLDVDKMGMTTSSHI